MPIYRVIIRTVSEGHVYVDAPDPIKAQDIASDISDYKDEVIDSTYEAVEVDDPKKLKGRYIETEDGYYQMD